MKKLMILFLLVSFMCFGEDKIEPKKSYEVIQREEIDFLKTQLMKSNNKIDDLSKKIEELEEKGENNLGLTYNVDQIYQNSVQYYESALEFLKWIIGGMLLVLGYLKWDGNKKYEKERKEITNEMDKRMERMLTENEDLKEKIVEQEEEVQRKTLKLDKKIKDVEFNIELLRALSEDYDEEKIMDLRRLIKKYSEDYWDKVYFQLGCIYENNNAILMYAEAIKLNPKYVEAYINRGKVYNHIKNYEKAIKDFEKAIELEPKNEKAYYNKAISKEELGNLEKEKENSDYEKVKQYYKEALDDYKTTLTLEKSHRFVGQKKKRVEEKLKELEEK